MARPGAYKSEKRKKELLRLKKQQEKRQRRLNKDAGHPQDESAEPTEPEGGSQEQSRTTDDVSLYPQETEPEGRA